MGNTAIVIGATGLVGRALVNQLAASERVEKIIAITRRATPFAHSKIHNQVVDFDRLEDYASSFQADWLFSCLGTTRKQAGSIAAQRIVDFDYQYKAAQLAAAQGVHHYLLVSSSAANAKSSNPYLQMKGELEQKVQALPFDRISIFQPSLLLGQREHVRMGEQVGSWTMPALCRLPMLRRFRPITGDQVAAKMLQVSQLPGPPLELFRLDEVFIE